MKIVSGIRFVYLGGTYYIMYVQYDRLERLPVAYRHVYIKDDVHKKRIAPNHFPRAPYSNAVATTLRPYYCYCVRIEPQAVSVRSGHFNDTLTIALIIRTKYVIIIIIIIHKIRVDTVTTKFFENAPAGPPQKYIIIG